MTPPSRQQAELIAQPPPREYDAGMVVIHGVGNHGARASLHSFAEPLLARLQAEGTLKNSVSLTIDGPDARDGPFEAISVSLTDPAARLLVVEGRWHGLFVRSDERKMSAWALRHLPRMMWSLSRYYARSALDFIAALLVVVPLGFAVWAAIDGRQGVAASAALIGLAVGVLKVLVGDVRFATMMPLSRRGKTYVSHLRQPVIGIPSGFVRLLSC